jgi:hypothetical protein
MSVLVEAFRAFLVLAVCVSLAMFIVVPVIKHLLINAHDALQDSQGASRLARQTISYPIVALLSRQRRARHADVDAITELFVLDVGIGALGSVVIQGLVTTVLCIVALWCVFILGYFLLTD